MSNAAQSSPHLSASGRPSSRGSPALQSSTSSQYPNATLHHPSPLNPSVSASQHAHLQQQQRRPNSRSSESSDSSQITALSIGGRPTIVATASSGSVHNPTRPSAQVIHAATHGYGDLGLRKSPRLVSADHLGHRPRQHSQGFFEPSLPTASAVSGNLTASQIAAQAAMQQQQQQLAQHARRRSQTVPNQQALPPEPSTGRRKPASPQLTQQSGQQVASTGASTTHLHPQYHNGLLAPHTAATTAANVVFPRSAASSPGIVPADHGQLGAPGPLSVYSAQSSEKETRQKSERSKMKLFSKPKGIGMSKDKDKDKEKDTEKREKPLPSPNRLGLANVNPLPRMASGSTINLVDSGSSVGVPSPYITSNNASTSALVPEKVANAEKEKEKHKHNFLSRQKHRLKDDHYNLPLSSASSNSKPTDPNAPQSLYSFAPSSPGPSATSFAKSMSGLDLRHGGRALRERKKEEKASSALATGASSSSLGLDVARDRDTSFDRDWANPSSHGSATTPSLLGPGTGGSLFDSAGLQGFGLANMGPDDAWPFLKAKLLVIFEGEDLRMPVEDFNRLVSVHIQRCIQKRAPTIIIEDVRETLQTGFASIDQTLRHVPDDKIVPHLVETWLFLFGTILPYMQAVFLPLDLEFKGRGPLMTQREALEFWGLGAAIPTLTNTSTSASSTINPVSGTTTAHRTSQSSGSGSTVSKTSDPAFNSEEHFQILEVRRMVLISYRDTIILPRYDALKAIFSRLSLESINVGVPDDASYSSADSNASSPPSPSFSSSSLGRPFASPLSPANDYQHHSPWAGSFDSGIGSYNSHGSGSGTGTTGTTANSTHDPPGAVPSPHRSRATSNTSAGAATGTGSTTRSRGGSGASQPPPPQHAAQIVSHVAETVGRLLQCISVLAAIHSGDDAQVKLEALARELKHNWLGRARTGRNRRGFVATKIRPSPIMIQSGSFTGGAVGAGGGGGGSVYASHDGILNLSDNQHDGGGGGYNGIPDGTDRTQPHHHYHHHRSATVRRSGGARTSISSQTQTQPQRYSQHQYAHHPHQIGIARGGEDDDHDDDGHDYAHGYGSGSDQDEKYRSYNGDHGDDHAESRRPGGAEYVHGHRYRQHYSYGYDGAGSNSRTESRHHNHNHNYDDDYQYPNSRDGSPTPTPTRMPSLHNSSTSVSSLNQVRSSQLAGPGTGTGRAPGSASETRSGSGSGSGSGSSSGTVSPRHRNSTGTRTGPATTTSTSTGALSSVVFGSIAGSRRGSGSGSSIYSLASPGPGPRSPGSGSGPRPGTSINPGTGTGTGPGYGYRNTTTSGSTSPAPGPGQAFFSSTPASHHRRAASSLSSVVNSTDANGDVRHRGSTGAGYRGSNGYNGTGGTRSNMTDGTSGYNAGYDRSGRSGRSTRGGSVGYDATTGAGASASASASGNASGNASVRRGSIL